MKLHHISSSMMPVSYTHLQRHRAVRQLSAAGGALPPGKMVALLVIGKKLCYTKLTFQGQTLCRKANPLVFLKRYDAK